MKMTVVISETSYFEYVVNACTPDDAIAAAFDMHQSLPESDRVVIDCGNEAIVIRSEEDVVKDEFGDPRETMRD